MSTKDVFCEFEFVPAGGQDRLRMIEVPLPPDHPDAKLTPGLLRETLEQLTKSDPELKSRIEEQQQSLEHNFHLSLCLRVFSKSSGEWNLLPPDSGQELAERTHIKVGLEKKENLLLKEKKKEKSAKKRKSKSRSPSRSKSSSKKSAKYNRSSFHKSKRKSRSKSRSRSPTSPTSRYKRESSDSRSPPPPSSRKTSKYKSSKKRKRSQSPVGSSKLRNGDSIDSEKSPASPPLKQQQQQPTKSVLALKRKLEEMEGKKKNVNSSNMAAKIAAIQSLDLDESAEKRRQTFLKFFYESEQRKHEPAVPKSKLALLDPDSEDEDRLMIDFDEEAAEEDNGSPKKVGHYQGEEAEEVGDHQEDMDLSLFDLDNDDVGVDAWKEMLGIDGDSEEEDREDKDARGQEESVSLQPVESSGEEVAKAEVETAKEECNISGTASDSDESEDGLRIEEEKEEPKKSIETDSENGAEEEIEETPRDANGGMGQTKENVLAKVDETQSDIKVEGPGYGVKENLSEREKSHDKYNGVEKTGLREAESVPENEEKAGGSISGEKNSIEPSVTSEGKNIGQKLEADSKNPKDEGTEEAQQETGDEEEVEDGEILTSSDDEDDAPGSREPADQNCSEPPPLNKKNFPSQNHPNHPFEVSSRGVPQFPPPLPFHPAHRSPSIPPGMGQNPDNCWGHQGPVHSNGHNQAHPMFDQPPPVQFHGPPPPIRPHFPSGGINQYSRSMNPMQSPPPTLPQAFPPSKGEVVKASLGLANKNPVQALYELCAKNCWTAPAFLLSDSKVSGSQRVWQMSVKVCDKTFKAEKFNPNKGEAKTDAARACLNTMGIILDEN